MRSMKQNAGPLGSSLFGLHGPSAGPCDDGVGPKGRVVLVGARIALADHFDVMRAVGEAGQGNGREDGRLFAPGPRVEAPFVVSIAGAIGPAGAGNAAASAVDAHGEAGGRLIGRAARLAGNRCSQRNHSTLVASVGSGADGG